MSLIVSATASDRAAVLNGSNGSVPESGPDSVPRPGIGPVEVETNLIFFRVDRELGTAQAVAAALKARGVLVLPTAPQTVRACTHLDVSAAQAERAAETIRQALRRPVAAR